MNIKYFQELPGVGEVNIYRGINIDEIDAGRKLFNNFLWIDQIAFRQLENATMVNLDDLLIPNNEIIQVPFLTREWNYVEFTSEKHLIAAVLLSVYDAIANCKDLALLDFLMPYDVIQYFRPTIESEDYKLLIDAIENSQNNHFKRFILLLLRRCAVTKSHWLDWLKSFISDLPKQINSYSEYTVQRDSRVTYTSIVGQDSLLYEFVDELFANEQYALHEKRHFIESLKSSQRAGEVLFHKLIQTNYRLDIAPINLFGIHFFADDKIISLIRNIEEDPNTSARNKFYAQKVLELLNKR